MCHFVKMTPSYWGLDEKPNESSFVVADVKRVLVTGFEPFGGHMYNISQAVAERFDGKRELHNPWTNDRVVVDVEHAILSVDEAGSQQTALRLRNGEDWDAILHVGLCERCDVPRIERSASNRLDMRIPDNQGRQLMNHALDGNGSRGSWVDCTIWDAGTFPTSFEISTDAGSYLCNETYFRTLKQLVEPPHTSPLPPACLFLHLPDVDKISVEDGVAFVERCLTYMLHPVPPGTIDVVAAMLPTESGHLVLQRSMSKEEGGRWEYPGGKCEPGETWFAAMTRELHEELGIAVKPLHPLGAWLRYANGVPYNVHLISCEWSGDVSSIQLLDHEALLEIKDGSALPGAWAGRDEEMLAHLMTVVSNPG